MHHAADQPFSLTRATEPAAPRTLALSGRLSTMHLSDFDRQARRDLAALGTGQASLDLSGLEYLDTGGALVLLRLVGWAGQHGLELTLAGPRPRVQSILELVRRDDGGPPAPALPPRQGLINGLGAACLDFLADMAQVVAFVGELIIAFIRVCRRPRLLRLKDVLLYMELVGVDGLPIVGLIALLLGLIMAFMSSLQLKAFGADIYVASLVGIAMVRELGPIMTAILVAGRSGSSFAAEIGTMKVNEEVDALLVMGFDPTVFLALPKIIAAVLMVPLLTLFADLLAILGGMFVGVVGLDLTVYSYVQETMKALSVFDITTGMLKAAVFAFLIAGVGCQRGFTARGGAEAVGRVTTSAVVAAMFMIIVADSAFAIVLYYF